jgi:hypothetical protein
MHTNLMLLTLLVLGICGHANAQDATPAPKLTVEASQTEVLLGNYIEVTFTYEGNQRGNFVAPDWKEAGFAVRNGPSQSSNFSMIHGVTKSSITYTYYVEPLNTGKLSIPSAKFLVGKDEVLSPSLKIEVFENPDGVIETPQQKTRELDFWGRPLPESKPKEAPKKKRATTRI